MERIFVFHKPKRLNPNLQTSEQLRAKICQDAGFGAVTIQSFHPGQVYGTYSTLLSREQVRIDQNGTLFREQFRDNFWLLLFRGGDHQRERLVSSRPVSQGELIPIRRRFGKVVGAIGSF